MTTIIRTATIAGALLLAFVPAASAKVIDQSATGFTLVYEADFTVEPKAAYDAFADSGSWWSKDHTYSHDAKNLTIDLRNGGCWCETLANGGFVRRMDVIHVVPGERLLFRGALGPLAFMGVAGSMRVTFEKKDKGAHVTMRYAIGGHDDDDFKTISKAVDEVLGEQFKRYSNFAATGKP